MPLTLHPNIPSTTKMVVQGFTAVNGLDRRESNPEATSNQSTTSHARTDSAAAMTTALPREDVQNPRYSSARNDSVLCPEPAIKQSPETAKRKRLITETIEHSYRDTSTLAGALSPKRRMTDATNKYHSKTPEGTLIGLSDSHVSIDPLNRERCSRERSPVPTRNQRVAPPQVRPETQAHLAESLATHLQSAHKDLPEHGELQAQAQLRNTTRHNKSPSEAYSPEDLGDSSGKRKRNFSNRTKTGCHTCRNRKKKCDEARPACNNCTRGGFDCIGYGPKSPTGYKAPNASGRTQVPLQSKTHDLPPVPHRSDGPRYDHWGQGLPTPHEPQYRFPPQGSYKHRRSHSRDTFRNPSWPHRETDGAFPPNIPPPLIEYSQISHPIANLDHIPYHQSHPSIYGPVNTSSPRESVGTCSSHNPPHSYLGSSETSEKYKMLIGEPYRAYIDEDLMDDRRKCKTAVERWNEAHHHSRATFDDEKGRLFECILDPSKRTEPNYQYRDYTSPQTRPGSIGSRVIINNPFACDYGYNIHIGDDTVIGAYCTIEDPCDIIIGSRVQIGKNVSFCGNVFNDGPSRTGSQATMTGGAIIVEDEVNIGTGTTIKAHRVIGKGASIGASSVVTKNIPPYTYAAGNPCRVIRSLPRPDSSERLKRHSRELTAFTTISSVASSGGGEDDLVGDRQLALENEQSMREMRARRGIRDQGK